jgi:hypothetical protein
MKYLKTFETSIFSNNVNYPQVYKPNNINPYIQSLLDKFKFKLDDYIKINKEDIQFKYNANIIKNKIYIIKEIDLDNYKARYTIYELTREIYYNPVFNYSGKEKDLMYIKEDQIILATPEEIEKYIISLNLNKFNL